MESHSGVSSTESIAQDPDTVPIAQDNGTSHHSDLAAAFTAELTTREGSPVATTEPVSPGTTGVRNRKRRMVDLVLSTLECPVCLEIFRPPIFQCENGHTLCEACKKKLSSCPSCRVPYKAVIRNRPLELLCSTMEYPCKYAKKGCEVKETLGDLEVHERTCGFRPMVPCPIPTKCSWKGDLCQVVPHLRERHSRYANVKTLPSPATSNGIKRANFQFALGEATRPYCFWMTLYETLCSKFVLILRSTPEHLYVGLAIMDVDIEKAKQFTCHLSITLTLPDLGKTSWTYAGHPMHLLTLSTMKVGQSACIPQNLVAQHTEDSVLVVGSIESRSSE